MAVEPGSSSSHEWLSFSLLNHSKLWSQVLLHIPMIFVLFPFELFKNERKKAAGAMTVEPGSPSSNDDFLNPSQSAFPSYQSIFLELQDTPYKCP